MFYGKIIAILIILISCSKENFAIVSFLREIFEETDTNITRVRTREELDSRSKEFVVLDFIGLVEQYDGYTAEEYDVETEDGYILKLHRISGSPLSPKASGKPVVYIGQGMFGSADFFTIFGPEQALVFLLADAGYDIWIGNFRGNTYSKGHTNYSSAGNNYDFWKFSMDEIATIDLPIMIDTVLEKTNQKKLTFIGYSLGTTVSYMFLSAKPEYNEKMNLVVSIAPVALFTRPFSSVLNILLLLKPAAQVLSSTLRVYQILPQSKIIRIVGKDICSSELGKIFCGTFMKVIAHPDQMNLTVLPTLFSHVPAGVSFNTVIHYYQMVVTGKFSHFDHGSTENERIYGSSTPPEYDLTKISSPQALFYSESDVFVPVRDVESLKEKMQDVVAFEKVPGDYNHLDYMWHQNARTDIYNRVLEVMNENVPQTSADSVKVELV